MSPHRCQFCGRRKGLRQDGCIVMHYVRGAPCDGAGAPPIAVSDRELEAGIARLRATAQAKREFVRNLLANRVNYVDPAIEKAQRACDDRADKLQRRLNRHRDAPARRMRQLATYGYTL